MRLFCFITFVHLNLIELSKMPGRKYVEASTRAFTDARVICTHVF